MKKIFVSLLSVWAVFFLGLTPAPAGQKTYTNAIGMELVLIPAGSFRMGCDPNFENCHEGESPQHTVTLTRSFFIGKYEVTQAQWIVVMGNNPSKYKGKNHPVEQVSWNEAQAFITALNQKEGVTAYRLPTEAEWEYAARAGSTTTYSFGDDARQLAQYAWYDGDSGTYPVGQLQPNKWGLYDIHGNVLEWVQDWYEKDYYAGRPGTDPQGPSSGQYRVIRGGGWYNHADGCRSAIRSGVSPDGRSGSLGFRVALPRAVVSPPESVAPGTEAE